MSFGILRRSAASALLAGIPALIHAELEIHPQHFGASVDYGQVVSSNDFKKQPITRTGAYTAVGATWDETFDMYLGMGGLFWYALPEKNFKDRLLLSGFGVGRAEAVYNFGSKDAPSAKLHMGLFDHKYNPDAKNLGEYLFRSGAYPGYIWTGGWSYVNSASYLAQGFRFELPTFGGMVKHDFGLYMERNISPTHDFSPSYVVTVKPSPAFEFGAGVVWQNGLSLRGDSVLAPELRLNGYNRNTKLPLSVADRDAPGYERGSPYRIPLSSADELAPDGRPWRTAIPDAYTDPVTGYRYVWDAEKLGDGISRANTYNGTPNSQLDYYSFKAFKAMARASLDVGTLFSGMKPDDFKVYAEWSWLGIQNQPYYYDKPMERMPVMFGLNLPTFGLLEVLNVEVDYRKSVFQNTLDLAWNDRVPIPLSGLSESPLTYRETGRQEFVNEAMASDGLTLAAADSVFSAQLSEKEAAATENAWHWSVYAKRKIIEGVSITGQVASDHLRHFDIVFGTPSYKPATQKTKDWYYVLRVEFGI